MRATLKKNLINQLDAYGWIEEVIACQFKIACAAMFPLQIDNVASKIG